VVGGKGWLGGEERSEGWWEKRACSERGSA
jgi:hypothetical protein